MYCIPRCRSKGPLCIEWQSANVFQEQNYPAKERQHQGNLLQVLFSAFSKHLYVDKGTVGTDKVGLRGVLARLGFSRRNPEPEPKTARYEKFT